MFLVIPKECLETLTCLKSLECFGPLSNLLQFGIMSKMLLDITREGLKGLESTKGFEPISNNLYFGHL